MHSELDTGTLQLWTHFQSKISNFLESELYLTQVNLAVYNLALRISGILEVAQECFNFWRKNRETDKFSTCSVLDFANWINWIHSW